MSRFAYVGVLVFVLIGSGWLEVALRTRVYSRWRRLLLALAPVVVAVVSKAAPHVKIPEWEQLLSAGNAAYNLLLAANALGFRANWTTGWIAGEADAGPILGLAPGEKVVAFIHIGTATTEIADRPRPALAEVVTVWKAP